MRDALALLDRAEVLPESDPLLPLVARGLVFEAGGKRLIDGIDLVLSSGAIAVVLGPNGAGKSLLLRLLHGMIEPSAGTALGRSGAFRGPAQTPGDGVPAARAAAPLGRGEHRVRPEAAR